jgi:hypothetical protein
VDRVRSSGDVILATRLTVWWDEIYTYMDKRICFGSGAASGGSKHAGRYSKENRTSRRDVATLDETEADVCAVAAAVEAMSAPANPALWSLAHPVLVPAT